MGKAVIEVEVDEEAARRYEGSTNAEKAALASVVAEWLSSDSERERARQEAKIRLADTMDRIGRQAQARGLTPEILDEILRDG